MNFSILITLITAISALIWLAAGWLRLARYARYFQLEGYESKRFFRWLRRPDAKFVIMGIASLVILTIANFAVHDSGVGTLVVVSSSLLLALVNIAIRPFDRQIKQPFVGTPRARRLIVMAYVVDALPVAFYFLFLASIISMGGSLSLPAISLISALCGGWAVAGAPLVLPLANLIMYPYEWNIRRYFLTQARHNLERSGATVIAITGSYGKTSTKFYLQHILDARYKVLATPKSYNTLMGISKVINETLANNASYEYFIVETDAYFVGENAQICKLVRPQIGMVMTVGPMHLERLGSMENIAKAQYEVIEALPPEGVGIFNGDDPKILEMAGRNYPQTRITVSQKEIPGAGISAHHIDMQADGLHFTVRDHNTDEEAAFFAPLYGDHNVTNILMATAVARQLGMGFDEITSRVATLKPADHRLVRRVLPDGTVIIDDAYSANPVGTQTALQVLALQKSQPNGHRIVISSGMFELGPLHIQENRKLGERIADVATDVILVGTTQTTPVQEGLMGKHFPTDHLHVVNTLDEAIATYRLILRPGDALLMLTDLPDTYA